ncbi:MAG: adenylosuccinate lyase [Antricoccus sp.]
MIERYTLPDMKRIWSDAHKYEVWCTIEVEVLAAHAAAGTVPYDCVEPVRQALPPTAQRVDEIEQTTQHDVIAFLTAWADNTTPREAAAYVHFGMTSSDLLDTALAVVLTEATDVILAKVDALIGILRDHGLEYRDAIKVGRTHGIHAEPDTWGHRVADIAFALARSRDRLKSARDAVGVVAISGAVGTYSNIDPNIEHQVAERLGLRPSPVSTQVIIRDGISEWVNALAIIATVLETFALEVRHGQRTEVRELQEPFGKGQKGSSAMPHKKNPIISERLAGLARLVRGYMTPVMEGIPLWHERDISHSSVERIALPDASIAVDYMLHIATRLASGLIVNRDRMLANLESSGGLIYTSAVLLELVEAGLSREDAYALVQTAAMQTWSSGTPFRETLRTEAAVAGQQLNEQRLDTVCDPQRYVDRLAPTFDRLAQLA